MERYHFFVFICCLTFMLLIKSQQQEKTIMQKIIPLFFGLFFFIPSFSERTTGSLSEGQTLDFSGKLATFPPGPVFRTFSQTVPSPDVFLGYKLGDHYTPHYKIVNYFKEVAKDVPSQVKLEQYGETYEGRPLILAFIASPENLQRLEDIRKNNLRLAGVLKDGAADENEIGRASCRE